MDEQSKAVLKRFARVFTIGAVANMTTVAFAAATPSVFSDLGVWLVSLFAAGVAGGFAALDKAIRWQE